MWGQPDVLAGSKTSLLGLSATNDLAWSSPLAGVAATLMLLGVPLLSDMADGEAAMAAVVHALLGGRSAPRS